MDNDFLRRTNNGFGISMIAGFYRLIVNGILCSVLLLLSRGGFAQEQAQSDWSIKFLHSIGDEDHSHSDAIKNVLLRNQDRQVLTCGLDGVVCLWDIETKSIIRRFVDVDSQIVWCMDMTSDERYLIAGGKGKQINVWDIESGTLHSKHSCASSVLSISVLNGDKSFLGADDRGFVSRWELDSIEPENEWRICGGDVTALAIAPDNSFFITGNDDGEVQLWEMNFDNDNDEEPESQRNFTGLGTWVCCLKLSSDGSQLIASDYSGDVALWDFLTGKLKWLNEEVSGRIGWVEFVDPEWIVAVDADDRMYRLNRDSGDHTSAKIGLPEIAGFALSSDRETIWCGGNVTPCQWRLESGERLFPPDEIMRSAQKTNQVALHNNTLFVGSNKPPVVAWDLATNTLAFQIQPRDSGDWNDMQMLETVAGVVLANENKASLFAYDSGEEIESTTVAASEFTVSPDGKTTLYLDSESQSFYQTLDFGRPQQKPNDLAGESGIQTLRLLDNSRVLVLNHNDQFQIQSVGDRSIISRGVAPNYTEVLDATSMAIAFRQPGNFPAIHFARNANSMEIDDETFKRLVEELESNDFTVREKATMQLVSGGPEVGRQVRLLTNGSVEQAVRIQRIQKLIGDGQLPDLQNPLALVDPCDQTIEAVCFDRSSRFMLASARNGWKSDLHIYELRPDGLYLVAKQPLRSRANLIRRSLENDAIFIIAYGGGAVDIIEIEQIPLSTGTD